MRTTEDISCINTTRNSIKCRSAQCDCICKLNRIISSNHCRCYKSGNNRLCINCRDIDQWSCKSSCWSKNISTRKRKCRIPTICDSYKKLCNISTTINDCSCCSIWIYHLVESFGCRNRNIRIQAKLYSSSICKSRNGQFWCHCRDNSCICQRIIRWNIIDQYSIQRNSPITSDWHIGNIKDNRTSSYHTVE